MLTTIRSYVRRAGRMTQKQSTALTEGLKSYSLQQGAAVLDLNQVFGRVAPKVLEIGFGMGHSLIKMAEVHPELDFLGVEVHRPGLGSVIAMAQEQALTNVRVIEGDAVIFLKERMADRSFDKIQIFFPDPWPKRKHHKRRLIQTSFVDLLCAKLKPGGVLHLATDWHDYAQQMMKVLSAHGELKNTAGLGIYAINSDRPLTKFERRGQNLGYAIWDLIFTRNIGC